MNTFRKPSLIDEHEASLWIEDGMTVAIGTPHPMGLVRQIIRRRVKNLTIIDGGICLDLLIAAGCVKRSVTYYGGGGFGIPVLPMFREAVERKTITVFECDEGTIMTGLRAAAQALPFLPWRGGLGTSLPDVNPEFRTFADPLSGQTLLAVPPIKPDIALLHADAADEFGNVQHIGGAGWLDPAFFRAADRTIVQVERIIPNERIRAEPEATTFARVDAVVRAPYGAHPFFSRGHYVRDEAHVRDYLKASAKAAAGDRTALDSYLDHYCYEPNDLGDYLEKIGIKRLISLYEF